VTRTMPVRFNHCADNRQPIDKMSLGDLLAAYLRHYSIQFYLVIAVAATLLGVSLAPSLAMPLTAAAVVVVVYPLAEYSLHRWVLHGHFLYKKAWSAKVWKRIHYDHHQSPHDLDVLFGALYTTLPTIALVTLPAGWFIGGAAGACTAFATGLLLFALYEFCHCVQHLPWLPKSRWLRGIKRRHLAHHFHNERGNYGITSTIWDIVFNTAYDDVREVPRSPTVFDLGYSRDKQERFPWVAALSRKER
jgi:sterol desaturase/sphingolipid hydroxylase (fatty acid hydroxylase superfamily)